MIEIMGLGIFTVTLRTKKVTESVQLREMQALLKVLLWQMQFNKTLRIVKNIRT